MMKLHFNDCLSMDSDAIASVFVRWSWGTSFFELLHEEPVNGRDEIELPYNAQATVVVAIGLMNASWCKGTAVGSDVYLSANYDLHTN